MDEVSPAEQDQIFNIPWQNVLKSAKKSGLGLSTCKMIDIYACSLDLGRKEGKIIINECMEEAVRNL